MALAVFLALLTVSAAAWMDLRSAKVDNRWLLLCLMLGLVIQLADNGLSVLKQVVPGTLLPLLLLFPFFRFRMIGAGDIKLFSVLGGFMGPLTILYCLFVSFLIGAAFAAAVFLFEGGFAERLTYFVSYTKAWLETRRRVPYLRQGVQKESLHMTVPIFLAVLLWACGVY